MRFTTHSLRSLVPALALAALAALTLASASAQSRFNVPFNFVAGGQNCPAGTYTLHMDNRQNVVTLTGAGRGFMWLIGPGDPAPTDSRALLTFDRAGSNYKLRTVQYRSQITARLDKNGKESIPAPEQIALAAY